MSDNEHSTAERLGLFYKELVKSGIPQDIASDIVRDAAHEGFRYSDGFFSVRKEEVNV